MYRELRVVDGQTGRIRIANVRTKLGGKESPNSSSHCGLNQLDLRLHDTGRQDRDHGFLAVQSCCRVWDRGGMTVTAVGDCA